MPDRSGRAVQSSDVGQHFPPLGQPAASNIYGNPRKVIYQNENPLILANIVILQGPAASYFENQVGHPCNGGQTVSHDLGGAAHPLRHRQVGEKLPPVGTIVVSSGQGGCQALAHF